MAKSAQRQDNRIELLSRMQRAWGDSPIYQAKLNGPAPDRVLFDPEDPYTPDPEIAAAIRAGRVAFGDEVIDCDGKLDRLWDLAARRPPAFLYMQEFSWLRHFAALDDDPGGSVRPLVEGWLDRYEKWSAEAWSPALVGERLLQMCAHRSLILTRSDTLWRSRVLSSMARQVRHLANAAHRAEATLDRLMSALSLCIVGHCLPGCEPQGMRGLEMARRELRLQLRADGGHVSRNPSRQLHLAVRLLIAQRTLEARGIEPPGFLKHGAMRAGAMALFFRCPDGKLAVFNGGVEDDSRALIFLDQALDPDSAMTGFARHSGYHKLTAGRAQLLADTGGEQAAHDYQAAGSIAFSSGRARIFGNCGSGLHRSAQWRAALMRREAHSALSFETFDGAAPAFGVLTHRRAESTSGHLLEIDREIIEGDGAVGAWQRRLFLAPGGADLRGEERLAGLSPSTVAQGVWRFHLYPGVKASLARDRLSVLLLLPNKEGWRFKSNAASLELEKSVYAGGGAIEAAEQIVLRVSHVAPRPDGVVLAKWALKRQDS